MVLFYSDKVGFKFNGLLLAAFVITSFSNLFAQSPSDILCDSHIAYAKIINADNLIGDSIAVCVSEEIEFSGFAVPIEDYQIVSHQWIFLDGDTLNTADTTISHSFDSPGYYPVKYIVTDITDCKSENYLNVYVSTYPSFDPFPSDESICLINGEFNLTAFPEQYSNLFSTAYGSIAVENNCITDDIFVPQYTSMLISGFSDESVVNSPSDIERICIDIEHSFPADISIKVMCPNGQIMALSQFRGGNHFLGIPVDTEIDCDDPNTYGVAWTYCFINDSIGNWNDAFITNNTIPAGDYESEGSFDELIGCPINGEWTLILEDQHMGDDGSIPFWSINFNPETYTEMLTFLPTIQEDSLNSHWNSNGAFISQISDDGNTITILPQSAGVFNYTYNVINDFGCSFDSAVYITVLDYEVNAEVVGGDSIFCDEMGTIGASLNGNPPGLFSYSWSPTIGLSSPNQAQTDVILYQDTMIYTVSVHPLGKPDCIYSTEITLMRDPSLNAGMNSELTLCWNDDVFILNESLLDGDPDSNGIWTNASGEVVSIIDPANDNDEVFYYTVADSISLCFKTSNLHINVNPYGHPDCCTFSLNYSVENLTCYGEYGMFMFELNGNDIENPYNLNITGPQGTITELLISNGAIDTLFNLPSGTYSFELSSSQNEQCSIIDTFYIQSPEPFLTHSSSSSEICINGSADLQVYASGGNDNYTHYWTNAGGDTFDTQSFEVISIDTLSVDPSIFTVFTKDQFECISDTLTISIDILDPLTIYLPNDTSICELTPFILSENEIFGSGFSGGDPYEFFTVKWFDENNLLLNSSDENVDFIPLESAWYYVELTDSCTTPMQRDSIYIQIQSFPNTNFSCDITSGCSPFTVQFSNLTDEAYLGTSYWTFGDGFSSSEENPSYSYQNEGVFTVGLTVLSPFGCEKDTIFSDLITSFSKPIASFSYSPLNPTLTNSEVDFINQSNGNSINYWEFNYGDPGFGSSNVPNPSFIFPSNAVATYTVFLKISNDYNCIDSTFMTLSISEDEILGIQGSFSPNGDGVNDFFGISLENFENGEFSMNIFNDRGKLVYRSDDILQKWNGNDMSSNTPLSMGVYIYQIEYKRSNSAETKRINGKVLLLK